VPKSENAARERIDQLLGQAGRSVRHALGKAAVPLCLGLVPAGLVHAQSGDTDAAPPPAIPTLAPIGEQRTGLWLTDYRPGMAPFFDIEAVELKPWAQGLFDARQAHDLEPHARCKASGAIRQFLTPYGVEIVEIEALKRLYIFDIGGPHTYREVFMDGRGHPDDLIPSNYGHNIGWWDGDTLVIDSTGYNEDFWFERMGLPHTEAAQVTETFRRTEPDRVEYAFVLSDPSVYDTSVVGRLNLYWQEGQELFEYICQQQNYAHDLMVHPGSLGAVGTISPIVP
jgi:hypothetical protein